eukprot:scaffold13383_cov81-Isochrysis_galbana.AAC.1
MARWVGAGRGLHRGRRAGGGAAGGGRGGVLGAGTGRIEIVPAAYMRCGRRWFSSRSAVPPRGATPSVAASAPPPPRASPPTTNGYRARSPPCAHRARVSVGSSSDRPSDGDGDRRCSAALSSAARHRTALAPPDTSDARKADAARNVSGDVSRDVSGDVPRDVSGDVPGDVWGDRSGDGFLKASLNAPIAAPGEALGDVPGALARRNGRVGRCGRACVVPGRGCSAGGGCSAPPRPRAR